MSGSGSLDRCENGTETAPRSWEQQCPLAPAAGSSAIGCGRKEQSRSGCACSLMSAAVPMQTLGIGRLERRSESSAAAAPSTTRRWYAVADEGHFRGADRNGGDLEYLGLGVSRDMERIAQRRCFFRCVCSGPGVGFVACQRPTQCEDRLAATRGAAHLSAGAFTWPEHAAVRGWFPLRLVETQPLAGG